jgi:CRISPR-associated protein Cmr3
MLAKFKILGSMFFRGPGEFDPSSRGVYSMGRSFILPTPSTIAGVFATLFGSNFSPSQDWLSEYKNALRNVTIRGPFVRIISKGKENSGIYLDFSFKNKLISYNALKEYANKIKRVIAENNYAIKEKILDELDEELKNKTVSPKLQERIGVGLKVRKENIKVVDEDKGLIYSAQYVDYSFGDYLMAEIYYEIIGNSNIKVGSYNAKLGGEGRVCRLIIEEGGIEKLLKLDEKANVLYVASPILYDTGKDILEVIKNELSTEIEVYGKVTLLGAGYSLLNKKRKPIYQALIPGSLIFLSTEKNGWELYRSGLGFAKEIGYGTVIPLNLKNGM